MLPIWMLHPTHSILHMSRHQATRLHCKGRKAAASCPSLADHRAGWLSQQCPLLLQSSRTSSTTDNLLMVLTQFLSNLIHTRTLQIRYCNTVDFLREHWTDVMYCLCIVLLYVTLLKYLCLHVHFDKYFTVLACKVSAVPHRRRLPTVNSQDLLLLLRKPDFIHLSPCPPSIRSMGPFAHPGKRWTRDHS